MPVFERDVKKIFLSSLFFFFEKIYLKMAAMKNFYNILGILYQVIFAKDSFIKSKLKKRKNKKYIFLLLNCLCD